MKFQAHLFGSLVVGATIPFLAKEAGFPLSADEMILIIPAIVLGGAISCDIDTNSRASKYYAWVGAILTIYWAYTGNYEYIWLIWIPFVLAKMFGHRKWTHSIFLPIGIVCLPIIIELVMFYSKFNIQFIHDLIVKYSQAVNGFALGIVVHIILDWKQIRKFVGFFGKNAVRLLYG